MAPETLIGGAGNDVLTGGFGDDVYQFSAGDGKDVITLDLSGMNSVNITDINMMMFVMHLLILELRF